MHVLFDSTTLISCAVATGEPLAPLITAAFEREFELVLSPYILDEVQRGLQKPYFRRRLSPEQAELYLATLQEKATIVTEVADLHGIVKDPADDPIIAAAVSAGAEYLVTGDKALLALGYHQGVKILTARAFFDLLREGTRPKP